jgi:hypothetical protein
MNEKEIQVHPLPLGAEGSRAKANRFGTIIITSKRNLRTNTHFTHRRLRKEIKKRKAPKRKLLPLFHVRLHP